MLTDISALAIVIFYGDVINASNSYIGDIYYLKWWGEEWLSVVDNLGSKICYVDIFVSCVAEWIGEPLNW